MPIYRPYRRIDSAIQGRRRQNAEAANRAGDAMIAALHKIGTLIRSIKFNPDQPRVPAGDPAGGQWLGEGGEAAAGDLSISAIASSGGSSLARLCQTQFDRDIFQCRMAGLRSCYDQAYHRYAACLARRQIPPLNY